MYIISQDSYFVLGMDNLLRNINPHVTHALVAFDRGDGKVIFCSMGSLLSVLNEGMDFQSFICMRYYKLDKSTPVNLLQNEIQRFFRIMKDNELTHHFRKIRLSDVEYKILVKFLDLQSNEYVCQSLHLSRKVVSNYKNMVLRKLGINSLAELIHIYNTWNDCFCLVDGKMMPDAKFLPHMESNELTVVAQSSSLRSTQMAS
ncbi:LuxR C-terminal-related transcriptional regulator [Kosakonia sp. BYX6]|uniref:LuxR C-terminal-related transcriptional regulator n=1 Tax=Kosakonia calanthes TaxID=3139408 RepID=A0ABZ3B5K6_9ENTR